MLGKIYKLECCKVLMCSYCQTYTQQVLALHCQHYTCVPCALKLTVDLTEGNCQVKCRICSVRTVLHQATFKRLQGLAGNTKESVLEEKRKELLKKLDMEQHGCQKKITRLAEVFSNSFNRIKHKFTLLKTQLESKEATILAQAEKMYKDQIAKVQAYKTVISQERDRVHKETIQNLDISIDEATKRLETQRSLNLSDQEFSRMQKGLDFDINAKPLHNAVFDLEIRHSTSTITHPTTPGTPDVDKKFKLTTPQLVVKVDRVNELMKQRERSDFNRQDSYQRIMERLNQSKKKINQTLSSARNRSMHIQDTKSIESGSKLARSKFQLKTQF